MFLAIESCWRWPRQQKWGFTPMFPRCCLPCSSDTSVWNEHWKMKGVFLPPWACLRASNKSFARLAWKALEKFNILSVLGHRLTEERWRTAPGLPQGRVSCALIPVSIHVAAPAKSPGRNTPWAFNNAQLTASKTATLCVPFPFQMVFLLCFLPQGEGQRQV